MSDIYGGIFGPQFKFPNAPKAEPAKKAEKGIPWAAKVIDDQYYVPLSQVAELLASNDVLPAVRKGIEARVAAKEK